MGWCSLRGHRNGLAGRTVRCRADGMGLRLVRVAVKKRPPRRLSASLAASGSGVPCPHPPHAHTTHTRSHTQDHMVAD